VAGLGLVPVYGAAGAGADELLYQQRIKPVLDHTQGNGSGRTPASARCPDSHPHVIGGGVELTIDNGDPFALDVGSTQPKEVTGGPDSWDVEANDNSVVARVDADQRVVAICTADGHFTYEVRDRTVRPGGQAALRSPCPQGTQVTGGGVETSASSSKVGVGATEPVDGPDQGSVPDDGWVGTVNNGTASPEPMGVWAVCARTGDYDYVHTSAVPLEDNTTGSLIKQCPNGEDVTGGGVDNSGTDLGSEVGGTFPTTDGKSWTGAAGNENTGANATMQVFAICLVPKVRSYIGPVETGGSVAFRAKLTDGKPRRILKKLTFDAVPINCDQGATTHGTFVTGSLRVKNNSFRVTADHEDEFPGASFKLAGHFNHSGTFASGTYREHGNLVNNRLDTHLTHCDTGTVSWSADGTDQP
jgi:hypothetical protein